ncbi:MAG: hypothetical protein D6719_04800 [Candidatus Dadabacteria bacterium]|nr:MAG: hypothetical protein D6719_04800 [Candidatus Dadabacteria bacterium]
MSYFFNYFLPVLFSPVEKGDRLNFPYSVWVLRARVDHSYSRSSCSVSSFQSLPEGAGGVYQLISVFFFHLVFSLSLFTLSCSFYRLFIGG